MCCEVSYLYIGLLTQLSYLTYVGFLNTQRERERERVNNYFIVPYILHVHISNSLFIGQEQRKGKFNVDPTYATPKF